jgi:putative DNA primase/helicase
MSLRAIVQTLGGDLYEGGRRANVPAPGHSAADRSVSLLLEGDRVVVHSFGDGDWRAVLDQLRALNLIDAANAPLDGAGGRPVGRPVRDFGSDRERREAALRLWDAGKPLGHSLAARYCRLRGLTQDLPGTQALRHHGEVPVSVYRPGRLRRPALLAGIQAADGRYVAVEVTYLAPNGRRAIDLHLPRKIVGVTPPGCAVRMDSAAPDMLVGEGVFATRAASEWFDLPGWALQSTRNLRAWSPPSEVRSVLIAADRGKDGEASAERLRVRLVDAGVAARVEVPPLPWPQWDQWANRDARAPTVGERGEEGTGRVRPGAG